MSNIFQQKRSSQSKRPKISLSYENEIDHQIQQEEHDFLTNINELPKISINETKAIKHKKLELNEILIYFPYQPYTIQEEFMSKVIESLDARQNALLQSPTGTGKTISLLCSTLAWLRQNRNDAVQKNNYFNKQQQIKIIYCSRTHTQLKQVAQELKQTCYEPNLSILGSRDQLCINPNFRHIKGAQLNQECIKSIKIKNPLQRMDQNQRPCIFFQKDQLEHLAGIYNKEVMNIEETRKFGQENCICPYFFERERKDMADLILMPYNYLLDAHINSIINVKNCVIIFDEAHNVQKISEEGQSFFISLTQIEEGQKELKNFLNMIQTNPVLLSIFNKSKKKTPDLDQSSEQSMINLRNLIEKQQNDISIQVIESIIIMMEVFTLYLKQVQSDKRHEVVNEFTREKGFLQEGSEIFKIIFSKTSNQITIKYCEGLFSEGITKDNLKQFVEVAYTLNEIMSEVMTTNQFLNWAKFLNSIECLYTENLKLSQEIWINNPINHYKLYTQVDDKQVTYLHLWCLDPALAFKRLINLNAYSIILTSGTLTPLISWECELRIPFPVQIDSMHVIDTDKNILAGIITKGFKTEFNFSYQNRSNDKLFFELGEILFDLCEHIPNGVLVVFSSYQIMNKCRYLWAKNFQLLTRLQKQKQCFWEVPDSTEFQEVFIQYQKAAKTYRGAIIFGVCRGKVSEGIDLNDQLCRAVFVIGVPYPPFSDKKVKLKKEYLDRIYNDSKLTLHRRINSTEWYTQQAIRATNQALGRVIRHVNDYGAIYLVDSRFYFIKHQLSAWIKPSIQFWIKVEEGITQTKEFFKQKYQQMEPSLRQEFQNEIKNEKQNSESQIESILKMQKQKQKQIQSQEIKKKQI